MILSDLIHVMIFFQKSHFLMIFRNMSFQRKWDLTVYYIGLFVLSMRDIYIYIYILSKLWFIKDLNQLLEKREGNLHQVSMEDWNWRINKWLSDLEVSLEYALGGKSLFDVELEIEV